jgi:hypothetical protein
MVVGMAKDNPSWGFNRTVGAMANLGYKVSKEFIRAHMAVMVGTDFFTVEVLTLKGLIDLLRVVLHSLGKPANLFGRCYSASGSGVDGANGA